MTTVRVQSSTVEPIKALVRDFAGALLPSLTDLFVRVRRDSDGFYFDWSDSTFKSTGWTLRDKAMAEVDASLSPGLYAVTGGLNLSTITNASANDNYVVSPLQTPGVNAILPDPGELKVGQYVDLIKQTHQKHFNRREIDFPGSKETLYEDDGVTVLGNQALTDGGGNPIVVLPGAPARIGKLT